jgi:hypothetical protein
MKILNDTACNLNWNEFKYNEWNLSSIDFNSTIGLRFNSTQIQLKEMRCKLVVENLLVNMVFKKNN